MPEKVQGISKRAGVCEGMACCVVEVGELNVGEQKVGKEGFICLWSRSLETYMSW
jgi:hypothetical protein